MKLAIAMGVGWFLGEQITTSKGLLVGSVGVIVEKRELWGEPNCGTGDPKAVGACNKSLLEGVTLSIEPDRSTEDLQSLGSKEQVARDTQDGFVGVPVVRRYSYWEQAYKAAIQRAVGAYGKRLLFCQEMRLRLTNLLQG